MRNGVGGVKWVHRPLRFLHSVSHDVGCAKKNEFTGLIYFCTVCGIGSQGVRNFCTLCEMSHEFHMPCENFVGCVNCLGFSSTKNL